MKAGEKSTAAERRVRIDPQSAGKPAQSGGAAVSAPAKRPRAQDGEQPDWRAIAKRQSQLIDELLAALQQANELLASDEDRYKLARASVHVWQESLLNVLEHSGRLEREIEDKREANRRNARRKRPATKTLREHPPEYLRQDMLAWAREKKTTYGFMKAKATAFNTTPTTLRRYMYSDLSQADRQCFGAELKTAATPRTVAPGRRRSR